MSRTIILPVGISVIRGLEDHKIRLLPGYETASLTAKLIKTIGNKLDKLSAELASLKALKVSEEDEVIFLSTDTDAGERAAKINAKLAEEHFKTKTTIKRIESLLLNNVNKFKGEGIPSLIQTLEDYVGKARKQLKNPILSISGGIKPVVPYLAIYGMLRRVPITYIFERTSDLLYLPPLPIDFDWAGLRTVERALNEINKDTAISYPRLKNILGENFSRFESLFENLGANQMTLSAFGLMLLDDLTEAREKWVMLSPNAQNKISNLRDWQRKSIDILLDRVRSPLWRAHKCCSFQSRTDLDVYKLRNTGLRIAGWVDKEIVYIAEIYLDHHEYERHLPGHYERNYNPQTFTPYYPASTENLDEDEAGDKIIAQALREKEKAEKDKAAFKDELNQALEMAAKSESELREKEKDLSKVKKHLTQLETKEWERSSWSRWKRLHWALFEKKKYENYNPES